LAPLIPYVKIPELPIPYAAEVFSHLPVIGKLFDPNHPLTIKPFGALVALGVYVGSVLAMRHGRERGIEEKKLAEFIFCVVGLGFVGGHMLDAVFYHPDHLAKDPLYLFMLWEGLSSYGGFTGAVIGALWWKCVTLTWRSIDVTVGGKAITLFSLPQKLTVTWRHSERVLPMAEVINSAFPLAWVFGRMGCASVHDHPGQLSDAWFAVRWPMGAGVTGRFDLGLIEMVLTIPLAVAFLIAWKRKPLRPLGFYSGWMCVAYAPVRFGLDFLRVTEGEGNVAGGDPRYGGLTPAQWACFGLLALGIHFLRIAQRGELPAAAATDEAAQGDDDDGEEARDGAGEEEAPASGADRRS
jgi:phosphatidylglycerol:prolipoprotein diacylglycerol transferase